MAWWIARVTAAANAWGPDRRRDSEPRSRRRLAQQQDAGGRRRAEEIPIPLGGHDIVPAAAHTARAWQCRVCHRSAARRQALASSRCPGSAVRRWASQAAAAASSGKGSGGGHTLLLTGSIVWCFRCGASACTRAHLLLRPCRGRLLSLAQAHQRLLLGLHPTTRVPLGHATVPEPGRQLPANFAAAVRHAEASATTAATARRASRPQAPGSAEGTEQPAWRTAMLARIAARAVA